jgi:hypothetical protein
MRRWLAGGALFAAAAAAALGLAHMLELDPNAANRLRDDAFYEFTWAINVADGRGPVVSDGVTTSGVQVLWSLLLVPAVWIVGPSALPTFAAWFGFALHVATASLWVGSARDRVAGWCVGLCWLGNPLLVRESQNGQETALACLCLAALWVWRRGSTATFASLGVLCMLARSDLFAFVCALALVRHGLHWRAAVVPALALAVHAGVNRALGGGWLPDSALPMAWLWHANHAAGDPGVGSWLATSWWYARPVLLGGPWALASAMGLGFAVFVVTRSFWPARLRALPAIAVGCASALGVHDLATPGWAAFLVALLPARGRRRVRIVMLAMLLAATSIIALHWAVRWYPRDYYVAPLVVVAAAAVLRHGRSRLLLLVFAVAQIVDSTRLEPEPLGGQREMEMAGAFLGEVLPPRERAGCFNSGIVTFHADVAATGDRRGIVNLDGCVDSRAFRSLREARLSAWLDEQAVRFVVDDPVQFSLDPRLPHASGRWFGGGFDPRRDLVEVARFDVPGVGVGRTESDCVRLYWRRGAGEPPPRPELAADLGEARRGGRYVLWPARAGESLEAERESGERFAVAYAEVATTVVLLLHEAWIGTGRLFVRGETHPVLVLPRL